ncbi:VOC family protein [Aestuariimicrobium sp. Y1814]|uniref:VOC family protein n=1 Tax=Aestuariimicrobium sp. Y1814 TaxID=3418742 RepID=UPI003DA75D6E
MNNITFQPGNLDHLVVTTTDLAQACDEFESRLGVRPEVGGKHPQFGTHNALVALGGSAYLEVIAIHPDAGAQAVDYPFTLATETTTRIRTFAAHPGDLTAVVEDLRRLGVDVGEVGPGSRTTPDGTVLNWLLTAPLAAGEHGLVPFLIDWQGGPSPAETIGPAVRLTAWGGSHPDPASIRTALELLGVPLEVGQGPAGLWVELTGPAGSWRL